MKLSLLLNESFEDIKRTWKRFYVPLAMAAIAGISLMIAVEVNTSNEDYLKIGLSFILAFMLTFTVDTFSEVSKKANRLKLIGYAISVILVALFYYYELNFESSVTEFRLMFIFGICFVTSMLAPFLSRKNSENGFWYFNLHTLSSIASAILYFGLLYAGTAALLASFEFLFDINLHEELFAHAFIFLSTFGATTYVLGKVPTDLKEIDKMNDYPKELKIITARIFVPIIGIYAILVYAFVLKLLFKGMAPDYEVTFQIMAFSSVGVLAYLFAWPIRNEAGYLKHFHKYFFAYLIPLLATLFVAIFKASFIGGLTQTRYFVIAFGAIMTFWSFYYLLGKRKDLRWIHAFASIVCLFALFAPVVGARPLALYSHTSLVENRLIEAGVVVNGNYTEYNEELELPKSLTDSIGYIKRSYSNEDVDRILDQFGGDSKEEWVTKLDSYNYYFDSPSNQKFYIDHSRFIESFDVSGYSNGYRFDAGRRMNNELTSIKDGILKVHGVELNIDDYVKTIEDTEDLTYYDPNGKFVIYFEYIWGEDDKVESASGFVFVK